MVFHFFVPFLILLARPLKRNIAALWKIAALVLVAHLVDDYWLIAPVVGRGRRLIRRSSGRAWLDLAVPGLDGRALALDLLLVPQVQAADGGRRPQASARPQAIGGRTLTHVPPLRPHDPRRRPTPSPRGHEMTDVAARPIVYLHHRAGALRRRAPGRRCRTIMTRLRQAGHLGLPRPRGRSRDLRDVYDIAPNRPGTAPARHDRRHDPDVR